MNRIVLKVVVYGIVLSQDWLWLRASGVFVYCAIQFIPWLLSEALLFHSNSTAISYTARYSFNLPCFPNSFEVTLFKSHSILMCEAPGNILPRNPEFLLWVRYEPQLSKIIKQSVTDKRYKYEVFNKTLLNRHLCVFLFTKFKAREIKIWTFFCDWLGLQQVFKFSSVERK